MSLENGTKFGLLLGPTLEARYMRTVSLISLVILSIVPACVAETDTDVMVSEISQDGEDFGASIGGKGTVNVFSIAGATFAAEIDVKLHKAAPNTTYTLQRAPEVGRPLATDGICQRANGLAPWGPPAPAFPTFVLPATATTPATNVTITTNGGGNGKVSFSFAAPAIASGATFDVMFRAIDLTGVEAPILSDCFTVTPQ